MNYFLIACKALKGFIKPTSLFIIFSFPLSILLLSCNVQKGKRDAFIGKSKMYSIEKCGTPYEIIKDSIEEKRLIYQKDRKIHNSKYTNVVIYTTYYLDKDDKVYKWNRKVYKNPVSTAKPSLAIE